MPTLKWIGKKSVINHHNRIEYRVLECKEQIGEPNSGNLIVKGDNLLALKALLPYYKGKVKMIYIDPPYNTGNTSWVYNDAMDAPQMKRWLDKTVDANDLSRSDKWLCMMYPRLKLLREFLREDGAIFVSIDDAEAGHLRLLMDSVFGAKNFVANVIWEKKFSPQNDAKWLSDNHDHIFIYAKNKEIWRPFQLERSKEANARYKNPDNDPRGVWTSSDLTVKTYSAEYDYEITTSSGKKIKPTSGRCWMTSKINMQKLIDNGKVWFGKNGDNVPRLKKFLYEVQQGIVPMTIWYHSEVGHNQEAKQESNQILGLNLFDTPKPTRLIQRILEISTNKNDIIMDSFAGSGTTAHAVLAQNEKDGGNRKFILVEMEDYAQTITTERVRRVIEGYDFTGKDKTTLLEKKLTTTQILSPDKMAKIAEEAQTVIEQNAPRYDKIEKEFKDNTIKIEGIKDIKERKDGLGGGFQYCELGDALKDEMGLMNPNINFAMLARHLYFTEFGEALPKGVSDEKTGFVGKYKDKTLWVFASVFGKKELDKCGQNAIVYAKKSAFSVAMCKKQNIELKKLPFDIKAR